MRVLLIGGTSNVGKSTAAEVLAARLGFTYVSTDRLGRHPGRPWGDVPAQVVEHYRSLTAEALVDALLAHYERMWPRIEELVTAHATDGPGLVLEGSGVWPEYVRRLGTPYTAAVWLTASEQLLTDRIHRASDYVALPADRRRLVDKFLARSTLYQSRMELDGLAHLSSPASPPQILDAARAIS
ncbi:MULTISPECIES: AAA family ATPase [Kribbella]|uniref:AAA domain-containing protein n=1 Tax=Kribbella karoonensis TaxID=324851 RepID=A0ABN2DKW2_9ACTN